MGIDREELREDMRRNPTGEGGTQMGGGPAQSDMSAPGGSSSGGGYRHAQNQQNHQGQQSDGPTAVNEAQSRGERFDEEQGGGRGADSVTTGVDETGAEGNDDDLARDQAEHQDRGQGWVDPGADRH